jgi:hypothetical protein
LKIANDPVVADAISPQAGPTSLQGFAEMSRILAPLEAIIEPVENSFSCLLLELPELALCGVGDLNGPGQALS